MLKINYLRSYKKAAKSGNGVTTVFVYKVSGNAEQLAAYKKAQGDNFVEDETNGILWFTTRGCGQTGSLIITSAGKVVADMSQFDMQASLAQQFGGSLGQALANNAAQSLNIGQAQSTPVQTAQDPEPKANLED